jgi:hypothetical protein
MAAPPAIAEGLRARLAYREASGWLAHAHMWVHPQDLALRDAGLAGSYAPAAMAGHLASELPATAAQDLDLEVPPPDGAVARSLRLAALWRRLAELRTWAPLADAAALRETLLSLGCRGTAAAEIEDWLALVHLREEGPVLIRAGRLGRDWMNRPQAEPLIGMFLAACLWREKGFGRSIALPFWSAPEQRHQRLALQVGIPWLAGFLECVAEAARVGISELDRLQRAAEKGPSLPRTARSRLPAALETFLRMPIVTARGLATKLDITPQAALGLLRELMSAGIIREATGRSSWRAFVLA